MKPITIIRNILALVIGLPIGAMVNGGIIKISGSIIPPPKGVNLTTPEGLAAAMHLMEPKHFIFPFLAHALGTLVGALVAATIAANHKMKFALGVGFCFFLAGCYLVYILPSPLWFNVLDLVGAYLPMGYLGCKIAEMIKKS